MDIFKRSESINECIDVLETEVYIGKKIRITSVPTTDNDIVECKVFLCKNFQFTGVARISMLSPEYINCEFKNNLLSREELDEFINALIGPRESLPFKYDDNKYPFTVWDALIEGHNDIFRRYNIQKVIPKDLPIPNYTLLSTRD